MVFWTGAGVLRLYELWLLLCLFPLLSQNGEEDSWEAGPLSLGVRYGLDGVLKTLKLLYGSGEGEES